MIQAIFYAMVLNEVAELGLSSRIVMDCMMSALWEINRRSLSPGYGESRKGSREHRFLCLVDLIANPAPTCGPKEESRLSDTSSASSDAE